MYIPVDVDYAVNKECKRRRYSQKTVKTYLYYIHDFLRFCKDKELGKISKADVRKYLEKMSDRDLAGNTMNTAHMAVKFLFEDVLRRKMWIDIKYSKVPKKIQKVLTKEEIRKLLGAIKNWKHRLMIELMYSAGLRVSEIVNLRIKDLVLDKNYGFVRSGKGNKDRLFVLAFIVREKIKNLIFMEKLGEGSYLFITNRAGKYSIRSLQQIVKKAAKFASLNWREIHCHTLRHSFATHLIENGYDVSNVQAMVGHKSPETSLGYIHSSGQMLNIKSPFDNL